MRAFFEECRNEVKALAGQSPASVAAVGVAALCYLCAASGLLGWQRGLIFYNILCASALLVIFDALGWSGNRLWRAALALGSAVLAYFFVYRFDAALDHTVKLHCFALYFLLLLLFVLAQTRQGAGQLRVLAQNGLLFGTLFLLFVIIYGIFLLTAKWLFDIKHLTSVWLHGNILAAFALFLLFLARTAHRASEEAEATSMGKKEQLLYGILYYSSFAYAVLVAFYCLIWLVGMGQSHPSVVHLVIWSSSFSLLLLWLKTEALRATDRAFLLLTGLLSACALGAVCLRIRQYGLTPNRYFVLLASLWLIFSCGWHFLRKDCRMALALLVPLVLVGVWTPLGAIDLSVWSQTKRLAALEEVPANRERMAEIADFLRRYGQEEKIPATVSEILRHPTLPPAISVRASLERAPEEELLHIAPYDYALMHLDARQEREYANGDVRIKTSRGGRLSVFYQDTVQAELDLGQVLRESLPVEQGQSAYSYEIRPEKRWIKVQGPELDIAVYVERADLKWEYPAGKPKVVTDLDADLEYRVFLAKRRGT